MTGTARGRKAFRAAEILFLGAVAVFFLRSFQTGELARSAARITPGVLAAMVGFQAALLGLGSLCWALILRQASLFRGCWRCFWARTAGFAVTYLTPSASLAGIPVRAELYREEGVDGEALYATVVLDTFLEVSGKVPCIAAGVLSLALPGLPRPALLAAAAVPMVCAVGAVLLFRGRRSGGAPAADRLGILLGPLAALRPGLADGIRSKVRGFRAAMSGIVRDRNALAGAVAAAMAVAAVEVAQTWFLLAVLGTPSLPHSFAIYASILVQGFTGVLPGNLGGMEGAHMAVFSLLGLAPASGLLYTAMLRSGQSAAVLCGILYIPCRRLAQARAVRRRVPAPAGVRGPGRPGPDCQPRSPVIQSGA